MTQPTTEPRRFGPPAPPPEPQGGGLNQRIGGLPTWGWLAIAGAAGVVILLWLQHRNSAASSTQDTSGTTANVPSVDQTGALETLASQIRDLQGAQSQPVTPTAPRDHGFYYFGIQGDPTPDHRYIGIPGVGYYWVPDIGTANQFLTSHPQTISLGQISQGDATTRFGPSLPWAQFGLPPTQYNGYSSAPGNLGNGVANPL